MVLCPPTSHKACSEILHHFSADCVGNPGHLSMFFLLVFPNISENGLITSFHLDRTRGLGFRSRQDQSNLANHHTTYPTSIACKVMQSTFYQVKPSHLLAGLRCPPWAKTLDPSGETRVMGLHVKVIAGKSGGNWHQGAGVTGTTGWRRRLQRAFLSSCS